MYITCILRGRIVTKSDEVFRNPENKKSPKYWLFKGFLKNVYKTICTIKTTFSSQLFNELKKFTIQFVLLKLFIDNELELRERYLQYNLCY